MARQSAGAASQSADWIGFALEEYRALYQLARMRLDALERRVPLVGSVLAGFLGALVALPPTAQLLYLVGLPVALFWYVRTTIGHARSFEDILRRIEEIEVAVNEETGRPTLCFQSSHPSRGRTVGGRTGTSVVIGVAVISLLMLVACGYLARELLGLSAAWLIGYESFLAAMGVGVFVGVWRFRRYSYRKAEPEPK